jgi:hypothetical protein
MATIQIDESVSNLQAFIAVVGGVSQALHAVSAELESAQGALEDAGREAEKALDGLGDALQEASSDLESAQDTAGAALEELASVAQDATTARLEALARQAEEIGDEVHGRAEAAQAEEDGAFSRLETAGFDEMESAARDAEAGVERGATESETAFAEVRGALQDQAAAMEAAGQELGASYAQAEGQLLSDTSDLAAEMEEVTRQWAADIDEALESGCTTVAGALESSYADWDARAAQAADATLDGIESALVQAAEFVAEAQATLSAKTTELLEGPVVELSSELDDAETALERARLLAGALETIVPELRITLRVVGQVDQLLANLD